MESEFQYPVKYAIMPIVQQTSWTYGTSELERYNDVVVNIVSKCYVICEKTEYKKDGSNVKSYDVVFPYQKVGYFEQYERRSPRYNHYGQCINIVTVDELYDTFDEAYSVSYVKNKELHSKTFGYLSIKQIKIDKEDSEK